MSARWASPHDCHGSLGNGLCFSPPLTPRSQSHPVLLGGGDLVLDMLNLASFARLPQCCDLLGKVAPAAG